VQIVKSYDGIFIHAGGSPQGFNELRAFSVPSLDEGSRPQYRNQSRIPGRRIQYLHSVVATGDRTLQWFGETNTRLIHEDGFDQGLIFIDDGTPDGGSRAVEAVVRFSGGKSTTFNYDSAGQVYHIRQFNRDFIDANDNSRPAFTNILILKTNVSGIPGDGSGRREIRTTGDGEGFFVCGGKYIEINWSRSDKSSPFVYTHTDGTILELGRGRTFICIIPLNQSAAFS